MVKKFTRRLALLVSGIGLSLSAGAQQYCTPTNNPQTCSYYGYIITDFSTTGGSTNITNNNSGCNYGLIPGQVHTGSIGSTFGFSVTTSFGSQKIWVDWNGDKDFDDADELVFDNYSVYDNYVTGVGSFVIPASATLGTTRMRVRNTHQDFNNTGFTSCDYQEFSEYEDYDFIVATPCTPPTLSTVVTNVSCFNGSNGAIDLTVTGSGSYTYNWGGGITTEDRTGLSAGTYSVTVSEASNPTCQATTSATVGQPSSPVSGNTIVGNVSCFGGSNGYIFLTPNGGTPPYTFLWNNGATTQSRTGLTANTYSVTITDANGCTGTVSNISVTQPAAAVSGNILAYNVSCFGGSNGAINLTPTGGTAPYTFQWNNNATTEDRTGLTANTYSVTITDYNSCTGTVSNIGVSQPVALDGTTVTSNVSCFGGNNGSINLTPTGGTSPYTFQWNNGATTEDRTGLIAGSYSVTIKDVNGCTKLKSGIIIMQQSAITASVVSKTDASCNASNGSAQISVIGGITPYSYSWSPSGGSGSSYNMITASNLAQNTYTCFITDVNGCTASKSVVISAPTPATPTVTVSAPPTPICYLSPATFTASGTNLTDGTYSWSRNGVVIPNEVGSTLTVADISKYKLDTIAVSVTGITGCVTTNTASAEIAVQAAAPPNPAITATGSRNLCEGQSVTLTNVPNASNAFGFSWKDGNNTEVNTTYEFTTAVAGTYTLTITDPTNGCTRTAPQQVITVKPLPVVNASADGALTLCPTGSVILSNSVVETGATYRWKKDGVTNVSTTSSYTAKTTGSYALTATLNGCSVTSPSFGVVVKAVPDAAVTTNGSTALCPGTSVLFSVANVAGYTYQWYNGSAPITSANAADFTATAAGSYKVAITNGNCPAKNSSTKSVTITNLTPTVTQTASSASSVTLRGNNGTVYGYQWYLDNSPIANATSQTYVATVNGSYTLELSRNGCTAMSSVKVVGGITPSASGRFAVEEAQQAISVYPNPSEGVFNIASEDAVNVIVRDIQGRVIANINNAATVDLTAQPAGMYLMQIMDVNGTLLQSERLMKK